MRVDPTDPTQFPAVMRDIGITPDPRWVGIGDPERRALLVRHRRRFLTATPEGRTRLRKWLDAGLAVLPLVSRWAREAEVCRTLTLFGDPAFIPPVVRALLLLPECVRQYALGNVVFVCVGLDSRAWTSSAGLCDGDKRMVVLGPNANEETILHELFHCWHAPLQSAREAVSAIGEINIRRLARDQGWGHRIDAHDLQQERLATGAAIAWAEAR